MTSVSEISKYLKNPNSIELLFYLRAKEVRYAELRKKMTFDDTLFSYTLRHLIEIGLVKKKQSSHIPNFNLAYELTPLGKQMIKIITKMSRMF